MNVPEIVQTREPERLPNGLYCQWFELDGREYKLSQHGWQHSDDEEYSFLGIAPSKNASLPFGDRTHPFYYNKAIEGVISPRAAALIIRMVLSAQHQGHDEGYKHAQSDIKKAIGI